MDCRDAHRFVQLRLDDEIEPADCAQLDIHLGSCAPCRARIEREQRFELELRARLRREAGEARAPAALRDRIGGELAAATPVRPAAWMKVAIAAGGVFFLLGVSWNATRGADVLRESVRRHSSNLPPDVRALGSDEEVDRFLEQRLSYAVSVPRLAGSGEDVRLVGARLANIHDRDVPLFQYEHRGAKVSLVAYPESGRGRAALPDDFERRHVGDRDFYVGAERGYNVVAWRERGTLYSLVSDVDGSELVRLASGAR